MTYSEKLKDPRWREKRREVLNASENRCEDCRVHKLESGWLEVHHCHYITGRDIWDYPEELLIAVCRECHEFRQGREQAAHIQFAKAMRAMSPSQLDDACWIFLAQNYIKPWHPAL